MAYTTQHGRAILAVLAVALLLATTTPRAVAAAAASTTSGCDGDKFPAGKSYAHCAALAHLGARLHWTYDAKTGSLSVAFVAKPAAGGGWVSWAINPTGTGMKGAQALLAFKGASTYVVNNYNLTGYGALGAASTAIAYKASDVAADESSGGGGEVRIFAKLQLGPGLEKVNHIWQVGSTVTKGVPAKHAFETDNTEAKGTLVLSGVAAQATEGAPSPAPAGAGASPAKGGSGAAAPSGGKSAAVAATTFVSAPALALLALAGFLLEM